MAANQAYAHHELVIAESAPDRCEQFVLSRSMDAPEGFETDALASWRLAYHPTLPVITIRGCHERDARVEPGRLGWLLGYPVTAEGRLLRAGASITIGADDDRRAFVDSLGGRFLAVFVAGPSPAIYPDAVGSYSSVFCPSLGVTASTPGLIPYAETTGDRVELAEQLGIPWTNSMYPLGLTPRHGIRRLLPNHHLDLRRWTMVRHGPRWKERGSVSIEDSVSKVAAIVSQNTAAVMDSLACYLQLTAGHDSRMILACARERRSELATYSLRIPDRSGRIDADVAARISKRVGVSHSVVPVGEPALEDLQRWLYRTSWSVGEPRGWHADTALRSLDHSRVHLAGNIGDLARICYWKTVAGSRRPATVEQLAAHAVAHLRPELEPGQRRAAASATVIEEVERWRDGAGAPDALALLDLLFVENRLACGAGIWPYAQYYGPGFTFFPMCHRDVIDLMMALPEDVRRAETFNQLVIRQQWPELLDVPFNTASPAVRAANFSGRVAAGLRRRLAPSRGPR